MAFEYVFGTGGSPTAVRAALNISSTSVGRFLVRAVKFALGLLRSVAHSSHALLLSLSLISDSALAFAIAEGVLLRVERQGC